MWSSLLVVFSITLSQVFSDDQVCRLLDDPSAPLWKGWAVSGAVFYYGGVDHVIKNKVKNLNIPPIVSQCLANIPVSGLQLGGFLKNGNCRRTATQIFPNIYYPYGDRFEINPMYNTTIEKFQGLASATEDIFAFGQFAEWAYTNRKQLPTHCEFITSNVNDCLLNTVLPFYLARIPSTPCCEPLTKMIKKFTGKPLSMSLVQDLLLPAEDLLCAKQQLNYGAKVTRRCGEAYIKTLLGNNALFNIFDFIQVPNQEACLAFRGKSFQKTTGETTRLPHFLSCCANYYDKLVSRVRTMPGVLKLLRSRSFKEGQCLKYEDFPFTVDENAEPFFYDTCLHFANGFRNTCRTQSKCYGVSDAKK